MSSDAQASFETVVIPSSLRAAREVEDCIIGRIETLGYSPQCAFAIRLALEEAMVNAHKHGNRGDTSKEITVSFDINDDRAVIRVRDEGNGFDPGGVPDPTAPDRIPLPSGRGIMLMRAYLDEVTFNERGNEVQLVKEKA